MSKKVAILMSTYNGEDYLEEQIQSILNQTYKNWVLYIRDDGSKDSTCDIIKKYSRKYDNVIFFNENEINNVGVVKSFIDLLKNVSADYYMFSDQDDVWLKDKVNDSVEVLTKSLDVPTCVFTDVEVVTKDLKPIRRMNGKNIWTDFVQLLFTNCVTGCTMAFNSELKDLIKFSELDFNNIYMHDWWIGLLAAAFGKLIYLDKATMLYRQHGDNVVGSNKKNTLPHVLYRLSHLKPERAHVKRVINIAYEFNREYGDQLQGKRAEYIESYANLKSDSSFGHNLRLVTRLVPQRIYLKGKFFFSYLIVVYHKDYIN
ncbi:MAG: glycosyltransferase family 2 protein [Limosilactobacillus reuteri]